MKKFVNIFLSLLCALSMSAQVNYTDIEITPTSNTLTDDRPALSALLPADFVSTIFSGGTPTMDRLYILMNIPVGFSDYEIVSPTPRLVINMDAQMNLTGMNVENPSFKLIAGGDVCLSYVRDGSRYVLSALPFDPTTRALEEVNISNNTTEKIYITGTTAGKLSAEMPEQVTILMPTYLNSMKQSFSDIFVAYIHQKVGSMLNDFTFNPNCEGFFQFTGGESTHLHIYTDNLTMRVKDKKTDFLGSVIATNAQINLMGIDGPLNDSYATYDDATLQAMSADDVSVFDEQQIRSFSAEQIAIIAQKMTLGQCSWLTPGQVLGLLGITDITQVMGADPDAIGMTLYGIFGDSDKAQAVGGLLSTDNLFNAIGRQLQPLLNASNPMDIMGAMFGGMNLFSMLPKIFGSMVEGAASPFAFKSNSTKIEGQAFNVHIHSKGENTITGGAIGEFKNTSAEMGFLASQLGSSQSAIVTMVNDLAIMFEAMVRFCSAPFAVRPSADLLGLGNSDEYEYTVARMLFDDAWVDGSRTNGIMNMPVEGKELDAPSIDIGNHNGQVEFNGGQYRFHTPVSNKAVNMFYVATMAICYREFNVTMPIVGQIKYRGIGTSVGWGPDHNRADTYRNVIFRDGTFSTYSAENWKSAARGAQYGSQYMVDAVGNGWYEHYTDLRVPYNTSVLGGSFPENTYVRRCDAAAEQGVKPIYIYIADPSDPTSPQYMTQLCERKELIASIDLASPSDATKPNGTVKVLDANKQMLTVNTSESTTQQVEYGTESLTADANDKVFVYVTGDCKVERDYYRNYVTALAPFGERHMSADMLSMGGDVEVQSLYQDRFPLKNSYLLYTQLNYYTFVYAGVNLGGLFRTLQDEFQIDRAQHHNFTSTSTVTNSAGQNIMTTEDTLGVVFSEITNQTSYRIENGIYSMLPVMSDMWTMISMPYDVTNVYVLETIDEIGSASWTEDDWHDFYERQGTADGDMAQTLVTSVLPDIFSGRGSGIRKPLPYIFENLTNDATMLTKLEHFNGSNFFTANYYLKKMKPDAAPNLWELAEDQRAYGNKWKTASYSAPTYIKEYIEDPNCDDWYGCEDIEIEFPYVDQDGDVLPTSEQRVLMQRDSVYAMYFPGGTNLFWNYKYLIFEGHGPQRINGKNIQATYASNVSGNMTYPAANYMALQGNSTFGNFDISTSSANPIFVVNRAVNPAQNPNAITPDSVNYSFIKYTSGGKRILPTSVYVVSGNNQAVRPAALPALGGRPTDIKAVPTLAEQNPSLVAYADKGLYLEAYQDQDIQIFSADGRTLWNGQVKAGSKTFVPATAGLYIIKGQQSTIKLINK